MSTPERAAAQADLLRRSEAAERYREALRLAPTRPERFLEGWLAELGRSCG